MRTSGTSAPGGTFMSERAERISPTISITPADLGFGGLIRRSVKGRPVGQGEQGRAAPALVQRLGDEGHEGMQEKRGLIEHKSQHGAGFGLGGLVLACKDRLCKLDIPVAEHFQTKR